MGYPSHGATKTLPNSSIDVTFAAGATSVIPTLELSASKTLTLPHAGLSGRITAATLRARASADALSATISADVKAAVLIFDTDPALSESDAASLLTPAILADCLGVIVLDGSANADRVYHAALAALTTDVIHRGDCEVAFAEADELFAVLVNLTGVDWTLGDATDLVAVRFGLVYDSIGS